MSNKVGYLVSKHPGWTPGTKSGQPVGVLGVGERVRAEDIPDVIVDSVRNDEPPYNEWASYEELEEDSPQAATARIDPGTVPPGSGQGRRSASLAGDGTFDPTSNNVADVLEYLKTASDEEVARVKAAEASSDRNSKQVADFQPAGGGA